MDIPQLVTELPSEVVYDNIDYEAKESTFSNAPLTTRKVPITIITGYLGSGKSTLLKQIGQRSQKRLAIILNEFGDSASIEKSVTIEDTEKNEKIEEWLDLGNGCLCCTVKDTGVTAIEQLIDKSKDRIDHILLETTGIADPAPIARMFWLDEGLSSNVYIDGVVTVLDSLNIIKCLEDIGGHWHKENGHEVRDGITTAHLQIALADVVLLNKIDLVKDDEQKISDITAKVKTINSTCPIYHTQFGDIDLDKILDLHAYEGDITRLNLTETATFHDDRVSTVSISFPFFEREEQFDQVERFIQYMLWEQEDAEIHRLKGVMVHGDDVRVVQGVRETYDIITGGKLVGLNENKLVFIGKGLSEAYLYGTLERYVQK